MEELTCKTDLVPRGSHVVLRSGSQEILLVHAADDRWFAISNRCFHEGGPLDKGKVGHKITAPACWAYDVDSEQHVVRCPWHGYEYALSTGHSLLEPDRVRVGVFDVECEDGLVTIRPRPVGRSKKSQRARNAAS